MRSFRSSLLAGLLLAACHLPAASPAAPVSAPQPSLLVYERVLHGRQDLPPGPSALQVRVRAAEEPTRAVHGARVRIYPAGAIRRHLPLPARSATRSARPRSTRFPSALTRCISPYAPYTLAVRAPAGCVVVVEVHLRESPSCLVSCSPWVPAHAIITTCAGRTT